MCVWMCAAQQVRWRALGQCVGCVCVGVCAWMCSMAGAVEGCGAAWRVCVCAHAYARVDVCSMAGAVEGSGAAWRVCVYVDGGSMAGAVEGSGAVCRVCVCVHMHTCAWMCAAQQVRWRAVGQFWRECVCVDVCSTAGGVQTS